jgi:hypothetical protein
MSKQSKLMLTELRYQANINAISNKPREKKYILQILPIFLLLLLNKNNKQYGNDIIC